MAPKGRENRVVCFERAVFVGIVLLLMLILYGWNYLRSGIPTPSPQLWNQQIPPHAEPEGKRGSARHESKSYEKIPTRMCAGTKVVYPDWPEGFDPGVDAVFIIGVR
jgi:hypothetical protein